MNATGLAAPTHPVKRERPALRTDQTRFISFAFVRNFRAQSEIARLQDRQSLRDVVVELDDQNRFARLGIELHQIARGLEKKLAFRLIEQRTIDVFDRRRFKIEKLDRRLHRFGDRCEEDEAQTFLARQRRDFQFGRKNCGERSFAAGENLVEIVWRAQKSFDAVTGPAFQQSRRHLLSDVRGARANEIVDLVALLAKRWMIGADLFWVRPSAMTISSETT